MSQSLQKSESAALGRESLEDVVDDAFAAAGGDMRAAILGLIRGQHLLEAEARTTTSAGYVRRRLR